LDATILGVAVLILVLGQQLTAATAIWTAVAAGLSILLVELLSRPALALRHHHAPTPEGEPAEPPKGRSVP
jgi:hypothetical protein